MAAKQQPLAVCTDCIAYSWNCEAVGQPCQVMRGTRQCGGTMVDVSDPINWKECSACSGTAISWDNTPCPACQESGWLLTRRR